MTQAHTLGPWRRGIRGSIITDEEHPLEIAYVSAAYGLEKAEAHARLIAAAPDLLAACEAALRYDESILGRAARGDVDLLNTGAGVAEGEDLDALYEAWMTKAKAAVAKAKGVSP